MTKPNWWMWQVRWRVWALGIALDLENKIVGLSLGPIALGVKWGLSVTEQFKRDIKADKYDHP